MATAPPLLSIEEYLRTSYHPDADYIDGEIEERNVGEYEHGKIQGWIFQIFNLNAKAWKTDVIIEQRIKLGSNRVRVCDVAILRADAPRERVITTPPLICIEVLSPEDRLSRAKFVLADYFAMGVANIWLIDPIRRTASTFGPNGLQDADPFNLTVPNSPIHLDLTEAFAALD
ncbi:MAG: Uma2 family endonuclease [Acidobacteriota bacterium]